MEQDNILNIRSPIDLKTINNLKTGTRVLITGTVYVARDAAHRRLVQSLKKGEALPFDLNGQTIFYMGPAPAKPGQVIGSAGPTTSSRMDLFTPSLLEAGIRAMIGKGSRSNIVKEAMKQYHAVYLVTTGGASALLAKTIKKVDLVSYEDLGSEALLCVYVEKFPAIVANDIFGDDLFERGMARYQREKGK
jgi:fumarate hydratase subunit beta